MSVPNFTGKKFNNGTHLIEITRQTNFGVTAEIMTEDRDKYKPIDYSWEKVMSMAFGRMVSEEMQG